VPLTSVRRLHSSISARRRARSPLKISKTPKNTVAGMDDDIRVKIDNLERTLTFIEEKIWRIAQPGAATP
jgi:hypothetical protein